MWAVGGLGAFIVGVSKTGIPGLGILCVALFAVVYPTFNSVGIILPLLIVGDLLAVGLYRRHASWTHLWRLFPWTASGVIAGWAAIHQMPREWIGPLIGAILLALIVVHVIRERRKSGEKTLAASGDGKPGLESEPEADHGPLFTPTMGMLAGFTTMTANAAGPIMILYLLAMRLPKMEFVGTTAWFFMLLNLFKVPFSVHAGMIDTDSFAITLHLAAFVGLGSIAGRLLLPRINQRWFERIALWLTPAAAIYLFFKK
jgi:uncharacterized protein